MFLSSVSMFVKDKQKRTKVFPQKDNKAYKKETNDFSYSTSRQFKYICKQCTAFRSVRLSMQAIIITKACKHAVTRRRH